MLGTLETLPDGWEAADIIVPLLSVTTWQSSRIWREDEPIDITTGLGYILEDIELWPVWSDHVKICRFDGQEYALTCGFASALEPHGHYPRVHLKPTAMRMMKQKDALYLHTSFSSHIDRQVHVTDYRRSKDATKILEGIKTWSHRRLLGLSLPRVRWVADFLRDDYTDPGSASAAGSSS